MSATTINWPECAGRLARAVAREQLHPAVLAWADRKPAGRGPWAVAFSGGADSLALLLLLWAHWPRRRGKLVALHFNHRLRGRQSDADEAFCRRVCRSLSVRFFSARWPKARRGPGEGEARVARFAFFVRKLHQIGDGGRVLWLGHQQDDIAETMFMRMARGSGTAGLAAPRPVHRMDDGRVHLRPLLTLKKAQVVAVLRSAGGVWREDASNQQGDFFRNRIRRTVVPSWRRAAKRDALAGSALSRELLEEDDTALEAWVGSVYAVRSDGALDLRPLAGKPRAIVRRALHRWLQAWPEAAGLSRQGFSALLDSVEEARATRHSLGVNGFAIIRRRHLEFARVRAAPRTGIRSADSKAG